MRLKKYSFWVALFFTLAIIVGSLISFKSLPTKSVVTINDKLLHGFAYMVITFFWLFAKPIYFLPRKGWAILVGVFLLGIALEILQGVLTSYRHAEILDAVANTTGILLGYLLFKLSTNKKNENV